MKIIHILTFMAMLSPIVAVAQKCTQAQKDGSDALAIMNAINKVAATADPGTGDSQALLDFLSDQTADANNHLAHAVERIAKFGASFKLSKNLNGAASAFAAVNPVDSSKKFVESLSSVLDGRGTHNIITALNGVKTPDSKVAPLRKAYNLLSSNAQYLRSFISAFKTRLGTRAAAAKAEDQNGAVAELNNVVAAQNRVMKAADMKALAVQMADSNIKDLDTAEAAVQKVFPRAVDAMNQVGLRLGRQLRQNAAMCDQNAAAAADVLVVLNNAVGQAGAQLGAARRRKMIAQQLSLSTSETQSNQIAGTDMKPIVLNFFKNIRSSSRLEVAQAVNWVAHIGELFGKGGKSAYSAATAFDWYGKTGVKATAKKLLGLDGNGTRWIVQALAQPSNDKVPVRYLDTVSKAYLRFNKSLTSVAQFANTLGIVSSQRSAVLPTLDNVAAIKELAAIFPKNEQVTAIASKLKALQTNAGLASLGALIDKSVKFSKDDEADAKIASRLATISNRETNRFDLKFEESSKTPLPTSHSIILCSATVSTIAMIAIYRKKRNSENTPVIAVVEPLVI